MIIVKQSDLDDEYVKLETKLLYRTLEETMSGTSIYGDINEATFEYEYVWKQEVGDIQSHWIPTDSLIWMRSHLYIPIPRKAHEFDLEKDIWDACME